MKGLVVHGLVKLMRNWGNNATIGWRHNNIGIGGHLALVLLSEAGTSELRIVAKHPRRLSRQTRTSSCHHIMILKV
jgi:hypothetical protein